MSSESYVFGTFRLVPSQRLLLDDDKPVRLGSRAFDILLALVERAGETLGRDELTAKVWSDTTVDEGALRVHLTALRKALGDDGESPRYIATVRGQGYRFDATVTRHVIDPPRAAAAPANGYLPALLTPIIGRERVVAALTEELKRRRLLTIVGPGGIGKTTVSVAVGRAAQADYRDGVWFVGLASLPTPDLVPLAVGTALGLSSQGIDSAADVVARLRDRQALIILDSCEHVVGAAAVLTESILRSAPGLRVLATSREPLRAEGEWLHRLASLEVPPETNNMTAQAALRYSAVQLFDERGRAAIEGFVLADADVPAVQEICRRLDGVPLALELAAARLDAFSMAELAARLDSRFAVLSNGHRTALPRQQTLRATVDWSYGLLSETEKRVLRRVAVFQGEFTLDGAAAVASDSASAPHAVEQCVGDLVDKSLIVTELGEGVSHYRLMDTTRAYALEELAKSGDAHRIMQRHADYMIRLYSKVHDGDPTPASAPHDPLLHRQLGDLRLALNWAFSSDGDAARGAALAAAATDFWLEASLLSECVEWCTKALASIDDAPDPRKEMILRCSRGLARLFASGMNADARSDLTRARRLAQRLQDAEYQIRSVYGLWLFITRTGDVRESLTLAESFDEVVNRIAEPAVQAAAHWMLGMSQGYLGEHVAASAHLQRAMAYCPTAARRRDVGRFGFDVLTSATSYHAMSLWLRGFPDTAVGGVQRAIKTAREAEHPVSLCLALAWPASMLMLRLGDLAATERTIEELADQAAQNGLVPYTAFAACARGSLDAARGDLVSGAELLRSGLATMRQVGYQIFYPVFLAELAEVRAALGQLADSLVDIDAALQQVIDTNYLWFLPEVIRIKAKLLALHGPANRPEVEELYEQSMAQAESQGALHWQMRAAMDLARLRQMQNRQADARAVLLPLYQRFTEGLATPDLRRAARLLRELA
jgi:predicted ATPase/DNA-binding winged helix-turn-helix (wHTH) protein